MTPTKTCVTCGETKPVDAFTNRKREPDGRHRSCRSCTAAYGRKYRQDPENPEQRGDRSAKWRRRNLVKKAAHMAVTRAVKRGELTRPETCQRCGRRGRIEAHHNDYSKPLDVIWLCSQCHHEQPHDDARQSAVRLQAHTDHTFACLVCGLPADDFATVPVAEPTDHDFLFGPMVDGVILCSLCSTPEDKHGRAVPVAGVALREAAQRVVREFKKWKADTKGPIAGIPEEWWDALTALASSSDTATPRPERDRPWAADDDGDHSAFTHRDDDEEPPDR